MDDTPDDMTYSRQSSAFEKRSLPDERGCFEKNLKSIVEDQNEENDNPASTAIKIFESQSCLFAQGDEID